MNTCVTLATFCLPHRSGRVSFLTVSHSALWSHTAIPPPPQASHTSRSDSHIELVLRERKQVYFAGWPLLCAGPSTPSQLPADPCGVLDSWGPAGETPQLKGKRAWGNQVETKLGSTLLPGALTGATKPLQPGESHSAGDSVWDQRHPPTLGDSPRECQIPAWSGVLAADCWQRSESPFPWQLHLP